MEIERELEEQKSRCSSPSLSGPSHLSVFLAEAGSEARPGITRLSSGLFLRIPILAFASIVSIIRATYYLWENPEYYLAKSRKGRDTFLRAEGEKLLSLFESF